MRKSTKAEPAPATDAEVNRYIAAYIMGVANRLANGASQYYRGRFGIGMSEWRTIMAIGSRTDRIVREVAEAADLDYAAASKSLKLLHVRGLLELERTDRRGRALIARLTPQGMTLYKRMRDAGNRRQERLLGGFAPREVEQLWTLLRRIEERIPAMNAGA